MARQLEKNRVFRMGETFMRRFIPFGLAPKGAHVLSVIDEEDGTMRSTPVTVIENEDGRWLVGAYGVTRWVRSARVAGWVELRRGRKRERLRIQEVGPDEGAPVLRQYVQQVSTVRDYFDTDKDAPVEAFKDELPRHPVFRVVGPA
jgi:hypothetical protein